MLYILKRRETIGWNPVPAEIQDDILEENACKALSLTGVNVVLEVLEFYEKVG